MSVHSSRLPDAKYLAFVDNAWQEISPLRCAPVEMTRRGRQTQSKLYYLCDRLLNVEKYVGTGHKI